MATNSDDGWDNYSEEEEEDAVQGVAGKVDESLELRDERACATGGGFSMPQAAPTSMGYHSCDCIEEGFNIQQTGIEGDRMSASDVSSVPIVTNQSHPSSRSQPYLAILDYRMASLHLEWRLARAHPAASQPQRPGGGCRGWDWSHTGATLTRRARGVTQESPQHATFSAADGPR